MKTKTILIIGLILLASISLAQASSISKNNKNLVNEKAKDGRIYGLVETQGHNMLIGVSDIEVACGKSLINYETDITNEYGSFEFSNLDYEDAGTKYYIWILQGQKVILPNIRTVELNEENSEQSVYYNVFFWNIAKTKTKSMIFNQFFLVQILQDFFHQDMHVLGFHLLLTMEN